MYEKISFTIEVEFNGSPRDFEKVAATLADLPVTIKVPPRWRPTPLPGLWLEKWGPVERMIPFEPNLAIPIDFPGGIRPLHVHLGDEIAFLDREQFTEFVGNIAERLDTILPKDITELEQPEALSSLGFLGG